MEMSMEGGILPLPNNSKDCKGSFWPINIEAIPPSHNLQCPPQHGTNSFKKLFLYIPPIFDESVTRKVLAELMGTFVLIFAAAGSSIVNEKTSGKIGAFGVAATSGLAVLMLILTTGHISGAHFNPAVTFAFAATGHFPWLQVPIYILAQVVASISASFALKAILYPHLHGGVTIPSGSHFQAFFTEFILTTILQFVNTAMATDSRAVGELSCVAVGATVTMNSLIAGYQLGAPTFMGSFTTSGASMNPVRTLGPAIAAHNYNGLWIYIIAPILGALMGGFAYSIVRLRGDGVANINEEQSCSIHKTKTLHKSSTLIL